MFTLVVFGLTFLLIAGRRLRALPIGRPAGALLGAVGMVAVGALRPEEAYAAIDLGTIALLLAMMMLGAWLEEDGLMARGEAALTRGASSPFAVLARVSLVSAALSAILVNDTVCVLMTPVVIQMCLRRGLPLAPFLITLAASANLGSAATQVGNPQNMLIAGMSGMSFVDFSLRSAPAAALCLVVQLGLLRWMYRGALAGPLRVAEATPTPSNTPTRWGVVVVMFGVVLGFLWGLDLAWTALGGVALTLLLRREDPRAVFARVDWTLLVFFAALFVVVGGVERTGLLERGFVALAPIFRFDTGLGLAAVSAVVTLGSNLVSNVPLVMLFGPYVEALSPTPLAWTVLAWTATVAGNLTLVGSVANLIVAEAAREHHELGFWEYLRFGILTTLSSLGLGVPMLVLVDALLGA
jgi:Na+/H+ antiporter NhaD/arsenite permease-like protein